MVHCVRDSAVSTPALPRFCPKCGSHRTEVIGRSNSGKTIVLRCNACGEVSEVTQDDDWRAADGGGAGAELEAILALDQILTRLQDAERQRVLRWAAERFGVMPVTKSIAPTIGAPDLAFRGEDLDDLFGSPASMPSPIEPLNADDELSDLFDEKADATESIVDVVSDVQPARKHHQPQTESADLPLDVLVADFVSEFRRLAVEYERA
jgi:hypothetical protein